MPYNTNCWIIKHLLLSLELSRLFAVILNLLFLYKSIENVIVLIMTELIVHCIKKKDVVICFVIIKEYNFVI